MTRIFHWFFMWNWDPMSGFNIRLVFTLAPRDSTLQYTSEMTFLALHPCLLLSRFVQCSNFFLLFSYFLTFLLYFCTILLFFFLFPPFFYYSPTCSYCYLMLILLLLNVSYYYYLTFSYYSQTFSYCNHIFPSIP